MACDYLAIRRDNERRYGTDIGRIGHMLLADRYDDRTHFIFELLQNAEDALARRDGWEGSRAVTFHLTGKALRVTHFGLPFDEPDVRGICGIAESTKDLTAIGRFGIGFKSVYAFTDRPEIHSGSEAFAIESFVWPVAASEIEHGPDETVIAIPLGAPDESGNDEIARGLGGVGASALLFLRQIEEIRWRVDGGRSGLYLRESEEITPGVRRVTVIGQEHGQPELDEEWLVFSRTVTADGGQDAGNVELAFAVARDEETQRERILRVDSSSLVVFFPTVLETHLGFLVQGPYRTTPSRDNVPRGDTWNRHLVGETASLLGEALCWLRDNDLLDTAGLGCLPLEPAKFGEANMFRPLYDTTKAALSSESLLPRFDVGHVPAPGARLGRTQELRELFTSKQLAALYGEEGQLVWLSGDITQDRTPELRRYLVSELGVPELTPENAISRLGRDFLEAQSDDWIGQLYEFLNGQPGLHRRLEDLPLIRLEDGTHVSQRVDGQPQAFLPGPIATGFPVVRGAVCATEKSLNFLQSLGLTQPDPVDDVVRNILPKYQQAEVDVSDAGYEDDIGRILTAFGTDSKGQREKLLATLRESSFVMAVDAGDGSESVSKPGEVYLATERLQELFAGVDGVLLVDDAHACLRGEDIRELLEACGATRSLRPVPVECRLSSEQRSEIRRKEGLERSTWEWPIADATLHGLDRLLSLLSRLERVERQQRTELLWDALVDVESRRGSRTFVAEYTWGYSHLTKMATFDAAFVGQLAEREWVPDADGNLHAPEFVVFDTLGWKPNPYLLSKIRFKPPIIDQLAKEAGIEPGVLDLLKKLGVTSVADLRARLDVKDDAATGDSDAGGDLEDALEKLLGGMPEPTPPVPDQAGQDPFASGSSGDGAGHGTGTGSGNEHKPGGDGRGEGNTKGRGTGARTTGGTRTPGNAGGRPFISYVATHPEDEEPDPDGLDQPARMALEAKSIEFILSIETGWERTPTHNPGFDLYETGPDDRPTRWCEVKAMTGSLTDRPVGLSRTQFDCARQHGDAYWLYVVEQAGTNDARIVRIQDPAGHARTFTFDHGWLDIAEVDSEEEHRED